VDASLAATLSVLENPGVGTQVNDLRKASLKLNKSLNLEGIRSLVERAMQKNNTERCVPSCISVDSHAKCLLYHEVLKVPMCILVTKEVPKMLGQQLRKWCKTLRKMTKMLADMMMRVSLSCGMETCLIM
jgi:hypothetical protein